MPWPTRPSPVHPPDRVSKPSLAGQLAQRLFQLPVYIASILANRPEVEHRVCADVLFFRFDSLPKMPTSVHDKGVQTRFTLLPPPLCRKLTGLAANLCRWQWQGRRPRARLLVQSLRRYEMFNRPSIVHSVWFLLCTLFLRQFALSAPLTIPPPKP